MNNTAETTASADRQSFSRYLVALIVCSALFLTLAGSLAWLVDPYYVHSSPRIEGFNKIKPHAQDLGNETKITLAIRRNPATLLIGNSRIDIGFDPDMLATEIPSIPRPISNVGVPGMGVPGVRQTLSRLLSETSPRHIYIGLV
ncbi:MAG: hypothetical protein AAGF15_07935 [Pseudomonadota bacterium]